AGAVATSCSSVGFRDFEAIAVWIVFAVNGDQGRYAETTFVFFTYFGARAFRGNHDDGDVFADLHAFFNDVETVGVGEAGTLFHQRHYLVDYRSVLFVWSQVEYQVRSRDQFFEGANGEAVLGGALPGLTFFSARFSAQGVGDMQTAVAHVQALVQTLRTTAQDDDFFAFQLVYAVGEFRLVHEAAFAKLFELDAQGQGVEVVHLLSSVGGVTSGCGW